MLLLWARGSGELGLGAGAVRAPLCLLPPSLYAAKGAGALGWRPLHAQGQCHSSTHGCLLTDLCVSGAPSNKGLLPWLHRAREARRCPRDPPPSPKMPFPTCPGLCVWACRAHPLHLCKPWSPTGEPPTVPVGTVGQRPQAQSLPLRAHNSALRTHQCTQTAMI